MEIGEEFDCGPVAIPPLRSNFMEYKFDIPYVTSKSNKKTFNYKQVLYENSRVNSASSKLFYKLNATYANITKDATSYNISIPSGVLSAKFSSNSTWYSTKDVPQFQQYQKIMSQPWFGGKGLQTCAVHNYDFKNALVRPATVSALSFSPALLNSFFTAYDYYVFPLGQEYPFGAVQVQINFTMSLPMNCNDV